MKKFQTYSTHSAAEALCLKWRLVFCKKMLNTCGKKICSTAPSLLVLCSSGIQSGIPHCHFGNQVSNIGGLPFETLLLGTKQT